MIIGISGKIGSGKDTVGQIIQSLTGSLPSSYGNGVSHWQIKKFAYKLKQVVSLLTGIPVEDLENQHIKDSKLGPEWDYERIYPFSGPDHTKVTEQMTVRKMLQLVGTEAMRESVHENVWVNALFADYINQIQECDHCDGCGWTEGGSSLKTTCTECNGEGGKSKQPLWIITDVRFPNEVEAIKKHGGIMVRINRPSWYDQEEDRLMREFLKEPPRAEHPSETALDNYEGFDIVIENNGTIEELTEKVKEILKHEKIQATGI